MLGISFIIAMMMKVKADLSAISSLRRCSGFKRQRIKRIKEAHYSQLSY
jgi:hypothetical protein